MDLVSKEKVLNNKSDLQVLVLPLKTSLLLKLKLKLPLNPSKLNLKLNNKPQNNKFNNLKLNLKDLLDLLILTKKFLLMLMDNPFKKKLNLNLKLKPESLLNNISKSVLPITMTLRCMFQLETITDITLLLDNLTPSLDPLELMLKEMPLKLLMPKITLKLPLKKPKKLFLLKPKLPPPLNLKLLLKIPKLLLKKPQKKELLILLKNLHSINTPNGTL